MPPLDWALAAVMGLLGIGHLAAFVDARTPLLVADTQGVRIRLGQSWRGLPWGALRQVEHRPRRGILRDGRLVLVVRNPERLIEELDRGGRRQSRISRKLYGAPFAVPLALSTRVTGAGDDLTDALARLAGDTVPVVDVLAVEEQVDDVVVDEPLARGRARGRGREPGRGRARGREASAAPRRRWHDPRPFIAHGINVIGARLQRTRDDATDDDLLDDTDEHPDEVHRRHRRRQRHAEPAAGAGRGRARRGAARRRRRARGDRGS